MRPVVFTVPILQIPVHGYGLMIVVGFLLATWVAAREARRRGLPEYVYDTGMVMLLAGILGGRLFYYVQFYEERFAGKSFLEFFKIWEGGLVFYGGAVAGMVGEILYLRWKGYPVLDCLDVSSAGVPLAMAFGRLGCFLNGCCFGRTCSPDAPIGVVFPPGSPVHVHHLELGLTGFGEPALPVHPVQLYQAGHDLLLCGILYLVVRNKLVPRGAGRPLLFVFYGLGRFFLEGMRADNALTWSGFTISQNLSIGLIVAFGAALGAAYAGAAARRRREAP
jgi:phosphatidylglycerol:prolipoprotein diacylglycerol transferase